MGVWRQIGEYLWIVKKDPDAPPSKWPMRCISSIAYLFYFFYWQWSSVLYSG